MNRNVNSVLGAILGVALLAACASSATPSPTVAPPTAAPGQTPAARTTVEATKPPAPASPTALPSKASEVPYYQGKTITMVVASSAGGGTDTVGRIMAGVLPKYIPGNPKIVVSNEGGGGGTVANNNYYNRAKPDGFTLLQTGSSAISQQAGGNDMVKYDVTKYRALGNVNRSGNIIMIRKGEMPRLTDRNAKPLVVGTQGGTETWQAIPLWGKELLGWNLRWVPGYSGEAEVQLAVLRGEVDIIGTSNTFAIKRMIDDGNTEYLASMGSLKNGHFVRRPDFPDIPTFEEMLGPQKASGIAWQGFQTWIAPGMVDTFLSAPPGTPDNIMAILLDAYTKMSTDPQFDSLIKKSVNPTYQVSIGKDTQGLVNQVLLAPPEVRAYMQDLQRKAGLIK